MNLNEIRPSAYTSVMKISARLGGVDEARMRLSKDLAAIGVKSETSRQVCLALDEALTNAIEHGSSRADGEVEVAYDIAEGFIELAVTDQGGIIFNPEFFEQLALVKNWGAGGRGILLIRKLADEVYFVFTPGKSTRVVMRKQLFPRMPEASKKGISE